MNYTAKVQDFRQRKNEHFASGQGPLREPELRGFEGLHYFAPDESWHFQAPLLPPAPGAAPEVSLQTNTGEPRIMALVGQTGPIQKFPYRLSVFAPLGDLKPTSVFIPFRDATSGKQTYGAGRYLDAPVHYDGPVPLVNLDFNMAYHPYCAYSGGWTCPLPPPENVLPVAVQAGERLG